MEEHQMSEESGTNEGGSTSGETPAADEFKAITTQEDLNRVIADRVKRAESKFGDYADLKAKAEKLDQIEQANQTEAEKATNRITELEAELAETRRNSKRLEIAAEHGITDADDIALFLTGNDEETLAKQAKRLADRTAEQKKNGPRAPREGQTPSGDHADEARRTFVRGLTGRD